MKEGVLRYISSTQVLLTMVEAKCALPENQEYEERSARIRKLREQVGGETDNLNTLTAALEAKKVHLPSQSFSTAQRQAEITRCSLSHHP